MFQLHLRRFVSLSLCLSLSWFPSMEIELLAVTSEARKCFIHSNVTRIFKSFFFFFLCGHQGPPGGENAVGIFFFLCGHQGPPGGENAVGIFFFLCGHLGHPSGEPSSTTRKAARIQCFCNIFHVPLYLW